MASFACSTVRSGLAPNSRRLDRRGVLESSVEEDIMDDGDRGHEEGDGRVGDGRRGFEIFLFFHVRQKQGWQG